MCMWYCVNLIDIDMLCIVYSVYYMYFVPETLLPNIASKHGQDVVQLAELEHGRVCAGVHIMRREKVAPVEHQTHSHTIGTQKDSGIPTPVLILSGGHAELYTKRRAIPPSGCAADVGTGCYCDQASLWARDIAKKHAVTLLWN